MAEQLMPLSELVKELNVDEAIALDYCRDEKLGWLYDNEVCLRLEELSLLVNAFNNEEEKEGREPLLSYGDTELRQIWERVLEREKKRKAEARSLEEVLCRIASALESIEYAIGELPR